jgi:5-hydroxyisourate hydrolase
MSAKLSTHVIDLAAGRPAAGMKIELWRRDGTPKLLKTFETNADGRTGAPLLDAGEAVAGSYELLFFVKEYYASRDVECLFLDRVPVRFNLAAGAAYHVPLLVTPCAYSTYRGS